MSFPDKRTGVIVAVVVVGALAAGCGSDGPTETVSSGGDDPAVIDPGDGGDYAPVIDPADFTTTIDNQYLPLRPGARWVYEVTNDEGEVETITVEVLDEQRDVMGVTTVVVHDVVAVDGEIIEDTDDWYAQDRRRQRLVLRRGHRRLRGRRRRTPPGPGRPASTALSPASSCLPTLP